MMKMRIGVFAAAVVAAVSVQAKTWNVSLTEADAQGLTGVASLSNVLGRVASGDTIVIAPGVYDLSEMSPIDCGTYAIASVVAFEVKNGALSPRQVAVHLRGQNTKPWYEKTPEEETVLKGTGAATIFYGHANTGRESSAAHITFENGKWVKDTTRTSYGGGAISFAVTQQCNLQDMRSAASNCVFRSCSSDTYGGGTYCCDVTDCLYTNCTAASGGGGAYGDKKNNNAEVNHTNVFIRCVFKDCSAPNGGGLYGAKMLALTNCTFTGCRATGGAGGGLWSTTPMETISGCTFSNCWALTDGGGVKVNGNLDMLTNCTFVSCGSTGTGNGGAVYTRCDGNTDILGCMADCLFTGCVAGWGGGGVFAGNIGDVIRCAFTNNVAKQSSGGGIFSANILGVVEDSIFVLNEGRKNDAKGGAFCANGGTISRLSGCEFTGNEADGQGGAVYLGCAVPEISGCVFRDNTATNNGGGLVVVGEVSALSNSVFCGNVAVHAGSASGGAAFFGQAVGAIEGCAFTNNTAKTEGGAVYLSAGVTRLENCSFVGNAATGSSGGALGAKTLIGGVTNCTFACNTAGNHGGALSTETHIGPLADSTFVSNVAAAAGGAIRATGTVASADRCTFSDNAAKTGAGGVNMAATSGVFTDCVFHSNTNNETNYGAHAPRALKMLRCRFSGYGDVCARDYDSCIFSNCVYRYTEPKYGSDGHGLITYPGAVFNGVDGMVRNCLVRDCHVSRIIATEGQRVDIENCTFANNEVADVPPEGQTTHAIMFFAFRGGNPTVASTNVYVNCIFADNWQLGKGDIDAFFQGSTSAAYPGYTAVTNCIYRTKYGTNAGKYSFSNFDMGDPKFVKDSAFRGHAPDYMIMPGSDAAKTGLVLGWHADGKDLAGNPRMSGGMVSMGAYESNLPEGVYLDGTKYDNLETAVGAAGTSKRIEVIGDRTFNDVSIAAERYFVNANGYAIDTTGCQDAVFDPASGTLSVGVSDIYELPGDYNIMSGDVAGLVEALNAAASDSTIVLSPGVYNLPASIAPSITEGDYASSAYLRANNKALRIKGVCKVNWRERPQERETVLKGGDGGAILSLHAGNGRRSTIYNISFEDGYYRTTSGVSCKGGGAISAAASDGYRANLEQGLATNCVFRNCRTDYDGGATYNFAAYDCLYTNNYAKGNGGGAYGSDVFVSGVKNTNHFENCVFVDNRTDGSGGALYMTVCEWVKGCAFVGNTADVSGGALYMTGFEWVKGCAFSNNTAKSYGAGLYSASICGTVFGSTFYNNTNTSAKVSSDFAWGAHAYRVQNFEDCTFGGYGDFQYPRSFIRCTFKGCRTIYPERVRNNNNDSGLITFRRRDSVDETFLVRNCLFDDCEAINLINNSAGRVSRVENCTITGCRLYSVDSQGGKLGHMFFTMRGGVIPDQTPTQYYPSTNVIVNCVFRDNHVYRNTAYERNDIHFFATSTSVPSAAANIVTNCVYETWVPGASTAGQPVLSANFKQSNSINFAKDDPDLAGQYPDYMPKRNSVAHGFGAWADWMAGAKDLAGTDMPASAPVDAGCYQCTLRAPGMMLIFK